MKRPPSKSEKELSYTHRIPTVVPGLNLGIGTNSLGEIIPQMGHRHRG